MDKTTWYYKWVKYNLYKPIRNYLCWYGYGYHLPEEELIERQRKFIERLKNETMERKRKCG